MERIDEVIRFIEYENEKRYAIEPDLRRDAVLSRLKDVIDEHTPEVIVKAGIGNRELLHDLVVDNSAYWVVVEPSRKLIDDFKNRFSQQDFIERINFINGDFQDFPIDYYKSDMLICIDYLDFVHSSKSIDEFKRALQFEGIFFLASVVLDNRDIGGIYDELIHLVLPVHNDFYLEDDLKTFLALKNFDFIKGTVLSFEKNLMDMIQHFETYCEGGIGEEARKFIEDNRDMFKDLYSLSEDNVINEPYFIGYFKRLKPPKEKPSIV